MPEHDLRRHIYQTAVSGILFTLSLPRNQFTLGLVDRLLGRLLLTAIDIGVEFDQRVGQDGLVAAADWVARLCGAPARVQGSQNLPAQGPLLIAANHPGYFDSMVIISQLPRQDLKALVGGIPYFSQLPNTSPKTIYTDHTLGGSVRAVRQAVQHLRAGGCVLLFPTGLSDPDPDAMSGAHERFSCWSDSVGVLLRSAPETRLVLAVVSGILAPRYLRHPIAHIQARARYQQRVAELFQIFDQFKRPCQPPIASPRLSFSPPIKLSELEALTGDGEVMPAIISRAQELLAGHMAWV